MQSFIHSSSTTKIYFLILFCVVVDSSFIFSQSVCRLWIEFPSSTFELFSFKDFTITFFLHGWYLLNSLVDYLVSILWFTPIYKVQIGGLAIVASPVWCPHWCNSFACNVSLKLVSSVPSICCLSPMINVWKQELKQMVFKTNPISPAHISSNELMSLWSSKGRLSVPLSMNFWKSSKRGGGGGSFPIQKSSLQKF